MQRTRRLLIGSLFALGITLPLAVVALLNRDERPAARLADGSVVRLSGVRYGPSSRLVLGPPWKRRLFSLGGHLPAALVDRMDWEVRDLSRTTPAESLLIATEIEPKTEAPLPLGTLVDSHGCRFLPVDPQPWKSSRSSLDVHSFPFFPRREPEARFELVRTAAGKTTLAAAFRVRNPVGTEHPRWAPEPVPCTRRSGPLTVTLTDARFREATQLPRAPFEVPELELYFHATPTGAGWRPVGIDVSDAAGGFYRFGAAHWQGGASVVRLNAGLCRQETAYKCRLWFSRALLPGARPDTTYDLESYSVSQFLASPTSLTLPNRQEIYLTAEDRPGGRWLQVEWSPPDGLQGRLTVTDTLGRNFQGSLRLPAEQWQTQTSGVLLPAGTGSVHLRFEIFRTRSVTFRVKPRRVRR